MQSIVNRLYRGMDYFNSGTQNSPEFHEFVADFKKAFTRQLRKLKATNITISKNHFSFSGFFRIGDQLYYYSMSDVRHGYNFGRNQEPELLIRTAENEKDYTGGTNHFVTVQNNMYKEIARQFRIEIPKPEKKEKKTLEQEAKEIIEKGYVNKYIGSNKRACAIAWELDRQLKDSDTASTGIRTGKYSYGAIAYSKCETEEFSFYYDGNSKRATYDIFDVEVSDEEFIKSLSLKVEDKGETVCNMFDPEKKIFLEPEAVALHDFIKGAEVTRHPAFDKALLIFRKKYPDAYYELLD